MLVKEYNRRFVVKYGLGVPPYVGKKSQITGLTRWFQEEWRNQRGEIGYAFSNDVYRPTKIITKNTPITFREISKSSGRLKRALCTKSLKLAAYKDFKKGNFACSKCCDKFRSRAHLQLKFSKDLLQIVFLRRIL